MKETDAFKKLTAFFSKYKFFTFKKREVILRPDEDYVPHNIYFLKSGFVKRYSVSRDGQELTFIIFKPGDFFPVVGLSNIKNKECFEAITEVDLWKAPREDFINFLTKNPDVSFELTKRVVVRFEGVLERMAYLVFGNAYEKVASILLICAQRFGEKGKGDITIPVPLTHRDIASLIGVTRETVSLEMEKLEKKGVIIHKNRIVTVVSMQKLQKESLLNNIL